MRFMPKEAKDYLLEYQKLADKMNKIPFASSKRINLFFCHLIIATTKKKPYFNTPKFLGLDTIVNSLLNEKIISGYNVFIFNKVSYFKIYLKFGDNHPAHSIINTANFHSRPGNKFFVKVNKLQKIQDWKKLNELGFLRTRFGFITIKAALEFRIGGELLVSLK